MIWAFLRTIPARLWGYVALAGAGLLALFKLLGIIRKAGKADDLQRRLDAVRAAREEATKAKGKTDAELIDDLTRKPR